MPTIETLQNYPLSTDLATQAELNAISDSIKNYLPLTGGTISSDTFKWVSTNGQNNMLSVNAGIAIGLSSTASTGVAIGNTASGTTGVAIGNGAKTQNNGVAIGTSANSDLSANRAGVAIGYNASAFGRMPAYGYGTAVGYSAKAKAQYGIALGDRSEVTAMGAIQLGRGTNNVISSLQVYDWQLLDANGNIPHGRLSADLENYILSSQFSSLSVDINNVKITKSVQTAETVYDYTQGSLIGYVSGYSSGSPSEYVNSEINSTAYPLEELLSYGYTFDELNNELMNRYVGLYSTDDINQFLPLDQVFGYNRTSLGIYCQANSIYGYYGASDQTLVSANFNSSYSSYGVEWQDSSGAGMDGTPRNVFPSKLVKIGNTMVYREPVVFAYFGQGCVVAFTLFKDYQAVQSGSHIEYAETSATYNYDSYVEDTYVSKNNLSSNVGKLNTTYMTGLPTSSNEPFTNSINLHVISKTGSYNDLLNKPDLTKYVELSALNSLPLSSYTYLSTTTNISNDIQAAVVHKTGNETLSGDLYLYHQVKNRYYNKYTHHIRLPLHNNADDNNGLNYKYARIIYDTNPLSQLYYTGNIKYTLEYIDENTISSTHNVATRVYDDSSMTYYINGLWFNGIGKYIPHFKLYNVANDSISAVINKMQYCYNNASSHDITYYHQGAIGNTIYDNPDYGWTEIKAYFSNDYEANEYDTISDRFIQNSELEQARLENFENFENFKDQIHNSNFYYKLVSPEISGISSISVDLEDKAINALTVDDGVLSATINFPPKRNDSYARDFFVRLTVIGLNIPTFIFQEPDGSSVAFDVIDNEWANIERGVNILMFTETAK